MKTEEIIKIFLILCVLYLLLNCMMTKKTQTLAEMFAETSNEVEITSGDKTFILTRFSDFKDTHKLALLKHLFSQYDALESNKNDQFKTFLSGENINDLRYHIETSNITETSNINDLNENKFTKIPLFIIEKTNSKDYLNNNNNPPIIDTAGLLKDKNEEKYTYYHTSNKMIFISENPKPNTIEVKKNSTEINKFNKLSQVDIPLKSDEKLIYYVLSESGEDFKWNL